MGKALARLLASKGANVIIVARGVERLEAALKEISVHPPYPKTADMDMLIPQSGVHSELRQPTLSLPQRRPYVTHRSIAGPQRSHGME